MIIDLSEGEIPIEGEGEIPVEGEGESPAEGEDETPLVTSFTLDGDVVSTPGPVVALNNTVTNNPPNIWRASRRVHGGVLAALRYAPIYFPGKRLRRVYLRYATNG